MKIRKYEAKDREALINILRLNTPEFFVRSEEQDFLQYMERDSQNYFIIEEAKTIIGSGGFNYGFENGKTARISWGMIHPEWQGKGVGTKLTQFRIEEIKKNPEIRKIQVRTTQVVYRFYEKQGFLIENIEKNYWAPGFDLYQMKIDLERPKNPENRS